MKLTSPGPFSAHAQHAPTASRILMHPADQLVRFSAGPSDVPPPKASSRMLFGLKQQLYRGLIAPVFNLAMKTVIGILPKAQATQLNAWYIRHQALRDDTLATLSSTSSLIDDALRDVRAATGGKTGPSEKP